jgi:hypothetical protein
MVYEIKMVQTDQIKWRHTNLICKHDLTIQTNYLVWRDSQNKVARLYPKNMRCGPRVKKVAHPCSRLLRLWF